MIIGIANTFGTARPGRVNLLCGTPLMHAPGRIHGKKKALERERRPHE